MMESLRQAWLVLILSVIFGSSLATVNSRLAARIEANKVRETIEQIPSLVAGAERGEPVTINGQTVYRALGPGGQVGWVVPANGLGFADHIEVLIGLDASAETMTGLYVLNQKETPGLGSRITEETWRIQFRGKSTRTPLTAMHPAKTEAVAVDSITGATISSEAVCTIVNESIAAWRDALTGETANDQADND